MKHMLDKLAGAKGDDDQDHAHAKMQVLQELRDMAMGMMGDHMRDKMPHEMHGVEVMAPDQEGLQKGLDLAQKALPGVSHGQEESDEETIHPGIHHEVARMEGAGMPQLSGHGQPDRSHAMENDAHDAPGHLENPGEDEDDVDDDELDSMIAELQAKKASRSPRFQK